MKWWRECWHMFRTFSRLFLPNPFDWMLRRTARKKGKKILLCWNRGLGDIALGLYAMVKRIRKHIPDAEITFLTRENLRDGFSMLEGVKTIIRPNWKRGEKMELDPALVEQFDLVIEKPSPTDWVQWQRGEVVPRLKWNSAYDSLYEKFDLPDCYTYVGVQVSAETHYGEWRNWPLARWQELFDRLEKLGNVKVLLFGFGNEPKFTNRNVIDLRGKTNLFELLSIVKKRCHALVLPDSGISSMTYYLDDSFPLRLLTLWADPNHGILKQAVDSPNPQLVHCPIIGAHRDLSTVNVDQVMEQLFPVERVGALVLAGGQGSRLGFEGPKGLFEIAGKTLFEWICKKVPPNCPLAIMTSPLNHKETIAYFEKNGNFGLDVHFFEQEMSPFLDENQQPTDILGPNGNGSVFRSFVHSGLADLFAQKGVDLVTVSYIENPLINPVDPTLIAHARSERCDVAVQCIERRKSDLKMGALVEKEGKVEIVEYIDLDPTKEYKLAYSGQIAFDLDFFKKMAEMELPMHWVKKKNGDHWIWKGEQFIFDVFPYAMKVSPFCVPRETHYGPIKGPENIEAVENQLRERA